MNNYIGNEIFFNKKIKPIVYLYIMLIITITLSLIIFLMLFNYKTYYEVSSVVAKEEDNYYLTCYVPISDIKYINNNNTLLINRKKYKYNIVLIDDNYYFQNMETYIVVKLEVKLEEKYKYNNLVLKIKLLKGDKKLVDYIINFKEDK